MIKAYTRFFLNTSLVFIFFLSTSLLFSQGTYPLFENISDNKLDEDAELLGALGNRLLYFDLDDGERKLWASDATPDGTIKIGVAEQNDISLIAKTEDTWYFQEEIGNTYHISVLNTGSDSLVSLYSSQENIRKGLLWQGSIYFLEDSPTSFAGDDLIKFTLETSTSEILFTSDFGGIRGLGATDNDVMFVASMDEGKMLGKTDGTLMNTATFHMLYPSGGEFGQQVFMESNGEKMFFAYHPSNNPYNLWVSDGTSDGTMILKEYKRSSFGLPTNPFAFLDGRFYFIQREAGAPSGQTFELHVSDGTVQDSLRYLRTNSILIV